LSGNDLSMIAKMFGRMFKSPANIVLPY